MIEFYKGTLEEYNGLEPKNEEALYFIDNKDLYLGSIKLTGADQAIALIGDLQTLSTTDQDTLVKAINEVFTKAEKMKISLEPADGEDLAKKYTLKQGGEDIGTIDIPKDLVVSSGEIQDLTEEEHNGKFLVLTLNNTEQTKIYIDVKDLVDAYTGESSAEIKVDISDANAISATILESSIAKTKLDSSLQTLIDGAVQEITPGQTDGSIAVDGLDVMVNGLGSMAYEEVDGYVTQPDFQRDTTKLKQEIDDKYVKVEASEEEPATKEEGDIWLVVTA